MRLMVRSSVDLPQPDGPMIAVTALAGTGKVDALERVRLAVEEVEAAHLDLGRQMRRHAASSARRSRTFDHLLPLRAKKRTVEVQAEHEDREDERAGPGERVPLVVGAHRILEDHDRHVGQRLRRCSRSRTGC